MQVLQVLYYFNTFSNKISRPSQLFKYQYTILDLLAFFKYFFKFALLFICINLKKQCIIANYSNEHFCLPLRTTYLILNLKPIL